MARPFRLIAGLREVVDRATLVEHARTAESLGYSHLCIHDHLEPQLAAIPMLTAAAMATERLRVCPLVLNNDLRHPAVVAQELATLDVISDGRLDVGIGAGWNVPEYKAIGLQFDPPGVRIERMTEAIAILRGLFADEPFSFSGRHYTITDLDGQPKPVQRPHPPFIVGGTRERVLRIAAREGDIVGLDLRQDRESLPDAWPGSDGHAGRLGARRGRPALWRARPERAPDRRADRDHAERPRGSATRGRRLSRDDGTRNRTGRTSSSRPTR